MSSGGRGDTPELADGPPWSLDVQASILSYFSVATPPATPKLLGHTFIQGCRKEVSIRTLFVLPLLSAKRGLGGVEPVVHENRTLEGVNTTTSLLSGEGTGFLFP